jgi:hypothetical protein
MPGQGKHTNYYDTAFKTPAEVDKKNLLEQVFPKSPFVGSEAYVQAKVLATANLRLKAIGADFLQQGDSGYFPEGVFMDYRGPGGSSADISTVKWQKGGDPLNPYVPDIRSPGPADGVVLSSTETGEVLTNADASLGDSRTAPPATLTEIGTLNRNYDPADIEADAGENSGTRNPIWTGKKIHAAASLGVDKVLELGDSMGLNDNMPLRK